MGKPFRIIEKPHISRYECDTLIEPVDTKIRIKIYDIEEKKRYPLVRKINYMLHPITGVEIYPINRGYHHRL